MRTILWSILFFSAISCERETETGYPASTSSTAYDTIYPKNYFPCWPGSWWKYIDSNGDTIYTRTDSIWHLDSYTEGGTAFQSDTFYVPVYEGIPIWGYEAHSGPISNSGSYPFASILSDSLPTGTSWLIYYWSGTGVSRRITAKDTTLVCGVYVFYPTITLEDYYSTGPIVEPVIARRYYTDGIGMVREDLFNIIDSTANVKWLIDYHINR